MKLDIGRHDCETFILILNLILYLNGSEHCQCESSWLSLFNICNNSISKIFRIFFLSWLTVYYSTFTKMWQFNTRSGNNLAWNWCSTKTHSDKKVLRQNIRLLLNILFIYCWNVIYFYAYLNLFPEISIIAMYIFSLSVGKASKRYLCYVTNDDHFSMEGPQC
jgi:hypothetical protein